MAIDKVAKVLPLNTEHLYIWYLEQKGVENPQKFIAPKSTLMQPTNEIKVPVNPQAQGTPVDTSGILNQTPEADYG